MDLMDALSKKQSQYSVEEIDRAQEKAKKTGRPFLDILQETTGKKLDSNKKLSYDLDKLSQINQKMSQSINSELEKLREKNKKEDLQDLCDHTAKDIADLNLHLKQDFGLDIQKKDPEKAAAGPEAFEGVEDALSEIVYGQSAFLKKLAVAFKRPFIIPVEGNHARNTIFITGPQGSGRHHALKAMAKELAERNLLGSPDIYTMDLARYNMSGKDNVFLQDLYAALSSKARIILFENYNACHISYLTYINDLVTKGECYLQDRYSLQKGQLVNVTNAFTTETVGTFNANGKYLVFLSNKGVEELANVFGAPFVNAIGDVCTSEKLTEESWRKIARIRWNELVEKAEEQLSFKITAEKEPVLDTAVASTGKNAGTNGLLSFFDRLWKSLATIKLEGDYPQDTEVIISIQDQKMNAQLGDQSIGLMDNLPAAYSGDLDLVKAEMDNIVGLTKVKEYIFSLEEYYRTNRRRSEAGLKASEVSKHMIFTGNPGTGKTTIARIISRYLKAIGVLTGGQLVEVSRADLVGRYVGHTAPLVQQVIKSAIGGVLFIDEAYSLYRGKDDSFGLEAIDTLVKGMEDNRDNLIVILAGYSKEMAVFLTANSGLKSRFPNIIEFPDYTGQELLDITKITVKSKGYVLDPQAEDTLLAYYNEVQAFHSDTAGNGRLVRNKVEEAILNQSRRLVAEPDADLSLLELRDFQLDESPSA